jgi:molybdopterin synthase sulfur carrier subunit
MRVRVKLYATLRRHREAAQTGAPFEAELPDGAALADLIAQLGLPREEVKVVFVNGRARAMNWPLSVGDQVGIFPPIGGG